MRAVRIAVIGGGPSGLFFAVLMKRADPSHQITVFERNAPDATFGFGVVFPERSMRYLRDADPHVHAAFVHAMVHWDALEYRHRGRVLRCGGHVFSGLARIDLLHILQEQARALGVELRFLREVAHLSDVSAYDVIVAADGINSLARRELADWFRPSTQVGRSKYIWLGTTQTFTALTFIFEESAHGWLVAHIYPHSTGASTFIVETDEETWRRAGFDSRADAGQTPGGTDEATLQFCDRVFGPHLDGHHLLGNNSRWLNFRTVRNRQWHAGNVVLIGDAAHTAHFSVGSGTRMALEDAIALAHALQHHQALPDALIAYERDRRPAVRRIQRAAEPSRRWFEGFRYWTSFEPEQFAFHHVARTRILTYGTLVVRDERFVRSAESRFVARTRAAPAHASSHAAPSPTGTSLRIRDVEFPNRIVATHSPFDGAGLIINDPGVTDPVSRVVPTGMWLRPESNRQMSDNDIERLPNVALLLLDGAATSLDFVRAVRGVWPTDRLLGVQVEAWDDPEEDAANDAALTLVRELKGRGCDLIVVSMPQRLAARDPERALEAHAHASDLIRNLTGVPTMLLGGDYNVGDVSGLILAGRADLCEWPRLAWSGWRPTVDGGAA